MKFARSIKTRLVIGYTVVLFASIILTFLFLYFSINSRVSELSDIYMQDELQNTVYMIKNLGYEGQQMFRFLSTYSASRRGVLRINYALFDSAGMIIASSGNFAEDRTAIDHLINNPEKAADEGYESIIDSKIVSDRV